MATVIDNISQKQIYANVINQTNTKVNVPKSDINIGKLLSGNKTEKNPELKDVNPPKEKSLIDKICKWFENDKNLAGLILCANGVTGICAGMALLSNITGPLLIATALVSIGLGIYCLSEKKD